MSSNVVALPSAQERRKWNPLSGNGRHRRTPEAWAQMERELAASKAAAATAQRDLEWAQHEVESLKHQVTEMGLEMRGLLGEVREMRALMSADPDNPANQNTITVLPPSKDDPEETQPISRAELFKDGDTMQGLRPVIRIGKIKPPTGSSSDAASRLVDRISSQSEKVPHVDPTQPIPLWDSPLAQGYRVVRKNTA